MTKTPPPGPLHEDLDDEEGPQEFCIHCVISDLVLTYVNNGDCHPLDAIKGLTCVLAEMIGSDFNPITRKEVLDATIEHLPEIVDIAHKEAVKREAEITLAEVPPAGTA